MAKPGVTNLVISMPVTVHTDTDRTIQGMNEIEKKVKFRVAGSGFSLDGDLNNGRLHYRWS